jgi:hypothetical protein
MTSSMSLTSIHEDEMTDKEIRVNENGLVLETFSSIEANSNTVDQESQSTSEKYAKKTPKKKVQLFVDFSINSLMLYPTK